jgi:hypothetical protein
MNNRSVLMGILFWVWSWLARLEQIRPVKKARRKPTES